MEFDAWLAANGFDPAALNDKMKAKLQSAWRAENAGDDRDPAGDPLPPRSASKEDRQRSLDEYARNAREENARCERITSLVSQAIGDSPRHVDAFERLGRMAIDGKWDVQKTELELLRMGRGFGPASTSAGYQAPLSGKVVEAAVCMAGGLETLERDFDEKTLEAAHDQHRHGLGLNDLIMTFARRNGYRGVSVRESMQEALRAAFAAPEGPSGMRASGGPSTLSLPTIMSNVANKFLRVGFESVDQAWKRIAATRPATDFKTMTSVTLTGDLTYQEVGPGGEIKHGTLGETTYSNRVDTYAKMLGVDRRDLVNDDLGALTSAGRRLGRGGALKLNDVFWTAFLDNSTFFASGNSNVSTGVFGLTAVDAADAVFRNQTDPDGKPTGATPRILLVPTALRISAMNLVASTMVVGGSSAIPAQNVLAGAYEVVSSPYMSNSSYTGYSAVAFYLLADPADLPVIEVVFLNGQQMPTVETTELDGNRLGIAMRGYHDFGASKQEYRGGVRSTGAAP